MANRYWNPATAANWGDANVWALTDGGTADQATPTSSDDVFFTSTNVNNCTTADVATCLSLSFTGGTGYTGTFNMSTQYVEVYGSLVLSSGMTLTITGGSNAFYFYATATGKTVTTAGKQMPTSSFEGVGGGWTLQDSFTSKLNKGINLNTGTLNTNGQTISTYQFTSSTANTRVLTLGASTITCATGWETNTVANGLTINANTSTIIVTGTNGFKGGSQTFYNVELKGTTGTITGSNIFNTLTANKGTAQTVSFTAGTTTTVTSFVATGTAGNIITITSATAASHTLSDAAGTNTVSYCTISYSTAQGGATWDATDGTNTDGGNNSGWSFAAEGTTYGFFQIL